MALYNSITDSIGHTPLIRLRRLGEQFGCTADLALKLEGRNPAASVKDRIAISMIEAAEQAQLIEPGLSTIVEATSGNTGVGLAMVCAAKGYHLILTMPENMSQERQQLVRAYGAEIILTPGELGMAGAITRANELLATLPQTFAPQQFSNPANPKIHYETTGPEIWQDSQGQINILVVGVGTGGTLTGAGLYLKQQQPSLKIVAVEPTTSAVLSGRSPGKHNIQGIGSGFIPDVLRLDLIDEIITVTDEQAYTFGRKLAREEGILGGISTGAVLCAALQIAQRVVYQGQFIVAIQASGGERYLSTPMWQESL
ncbi:MAG: cysteine synthase A [Prochlorotrichaceae cyanobacterium]|jgi:cysteine synthase A